MWPALQKVFTPGPNVTSYVTPERQMAADAKVRRRTAETSSVGRLNVMTK